MATHRISLLGVNTRPDDSGLVIPEPYDIRATNKKWRHFGFVFLNSGSSRINIYGLFDIPKIYVGSAKLIIVWTAQVTTGNAVWDFDYRAVGGDNAESFDQTGQDESVTVTDAAPGAVDRRLEVSINLTSANFAADDTVEYLFARDKSDSADTLVGPVTLKRLLFEFADA